MIYVKKIASVVSLAVLLASGTVYAESNNATMGQETQKSGKVLLNSAYSYLGTLDKYAFRAQVSNVVNEDSSDIVTKRVADVKVQRPNQFRVDSKGEFVDRTFYLSNGVFSMIDNKEKYYATVKTDTGIDKTLEKINKKFGIVLPLTTLLHSDMDKYIHPSKVQYFGTRMLAGVECNYIAFKQGKTVVHMWIENSDTPLIYAAKVITNERDDKGSTEMSMKWDTKPGFSDSVFAFKAPKGASNISIKPMK